MKDILLHMISLFIQLVASTAIACYFGGVTLGLLIGAFLVYAAITGIFLGANFVDLEYGLSQKDNT